MGFLLPLYIALHMLVNEGTSFVAIAVAAYLFLGILGRG